MLYLVLLRSCSWRAEARLWRKRLVRPHLNLADWPDGRRLAAVALNLDIAALPARRPFTANQNRDLDCLLNGADGCPIGEGGAL